MIAASLCFAIVLSGIAFARAATIVFGMYTVAAIAPGAPWSYAHPEVDGSENWYIRAVIVNNARLVEGVDYTVVDDGSNKGVVIFAVPPIRGDLVVIDGPTLEPGAHTGTILFL